MYGDEHDQYKIYKEKYCVEKFIDHIKEEKTTCSKRFLGNL